MNKITKLILKTISTLIVIVVIAFAFLLVGIRVFGVEIYSVLSGSMEPTYQVGSLIYVVEVETNELKKGDSITFKLNDNTIATHRIVEIEEENTQKKFYTQGDANKIRDANPVTENQIIGKPIFTIPLLGYIAYFMQTTNGMLITLGIAAALIIIVVIIDLAIEDKKREENT